MPPRLKKHRSNRKNYFVFFILKTLVFLLSFNQNANIEKDLDDIREHVVKQSQKLENIIDTIPKTDEDDNDSPKRKNEKDLLEQLPSLIDELENRLNSLLEEKDQLTK